MAASYGTYIVKNSIVFNLEYLKYSKVGKAWEVPGSTHRPFITALSEFNHIRTAISKGFCIFLELEHHNHNRLLSGISRNIKLETNKDPFMFEQIWKYHPLQQNKLYTVHVIKELTEAKIGAINLNVSKEKLLIFCSICAVTNMVLGCFLLCVLSTIFYLCMCTFMYEEDNKEIII